MILTDNETKIDLLNNEAIAHTIIELLQDRPDQPVTIGVHGDWGAGKSSVLEMIEAGLEKQTDVLCLKFNGWRFQGFEDAKIALIEGIVTGLVEKRPTLTRMGETVKDVFRRIDWLKIAKKAGGLALTAFSGIPTPDQIQAIVHNLHGIIANPSKLATKDNIEAIIGGVQELIKLKGEADSTNVPDEINAFRKSFDELLDKAGVKQLVVLIDDLDRCLPDTAIETLEAVRLFVFTSRTAFVVAADEAMIEYAVRKHFPDLPDTTGPLAYARNYLEKLIQIPFRIPALGDTETRIYVTLLLVAAEIGEESEAFNSLLSVARERLKRPWMTNTLDAETLKNTLGRGASKATNALTLSDQIGPILASGTNGNPRQIKRFLNTLILRQSIAHARGFGDDIKLPVMAKLMLDERFIPRLFDQIAFNVASATDGKFKELHELEIALIQEQGKCKGHASKHKTSQKKEKDDTADVQSSSPSNESILLNEWLSSAAIKDWATIPILIGVEDLRPYLFVAKDRKDYFGSASVLGHLVAVVEQLFGSKFAVQSLEAELKRLATPEAAQLFEAVRGRIVGGDNFDTEPQGVAGLGVLVKAHPELQSNLLDFLEMLPTKKLGPWVCKGWEGVLKDSNAIQRFNSLLLTWSKDGEPFLKATSSGVLRTRQGGK